MGAVVEDIFVPIGQTLASGGLGVAVTQAAAASATPSVGMYVAGVAGSTVTVPPYAAVRSFPDQSLALRARFQELVDRWRRETDHVSSMTKIIMHPAYQSLIGIGEPALPLIFDQLKTRGGHWFWALRAITRHDAASGMVDFDQAKTAWLTWGEVHGYVRR